MMYLYVLVRDGKYMNSDGHFSEKLSNAFFYKEHELEDLQDSLMEGESIYEYEVSLVGTVTRE